MPDRSPARWRPHMRLIVAILAVALAIATLTLFLATRQLGEGEVTLPSPTSTPAATPAVVPTAPASPAAIVWPPGSLPALLAMAPDRLDTDTGLPVRATYADLAGWLDARGIDPATADAATIREAIAPLALPEPVANNGLSERWRADYGFDLRQVDAVLAVGQAPNLVLIMPGRYDTDALFATWAANGYQAVEVEETTVWSLAPGDRIDLSAPASRPSLGLLNTVTVLDDGTLIATPRQSLMARTLRVVHGQARSLAGHDGLRAALPGSVDAASAVLAGGDLLAAPAAAPASLATPDGAALPPPDLVLFTLPSEPGAATIEMTLIYEEPADRPAAIRRALTARVAADPVWSSRWRVDAIHIAGGGRLVRIAIAGTAGREPGLEIVDPRELSPFRWAPAG